MAGSERTLLAQGGRRQHEAECGRYAENRKPSSKESLICGPCKERAARVYAEAKSKLDSTTINLGLEIGNVQTLEEIGLEHGNVQTLEEMKKYKVLVTLDPETASCGLSLSEDGRRVSHPETLQTVYYDPERFFARNCVLGRQGFSSGKHYWEVHILEVGGGWLVGVARKSVSRMETVPKSTEDGLWVVQGGPGSMHVLREQPRKVGVYLDYDARRLSMFNADSMEHINTFTEANFNEEVFPYFWLGRSDLRLV
ncbi:E3 ubiquitin-protein ligase TRIM39-like [Ambystoma mexicanum]|uniref:E3 ubiquitin-protein ligase TRIM39-like n=1 Tax=Ambystoma mexicanum TaxID=8296 RepID=UPI0037E8F4DB